ncbi:tautomerase family protein [Rhizobium sp. BK251]|uniref:tautomerase family protein n=1 Tax=Rhizobium sp. BK251 TaxID=2512125 RepID=UPI0010503EC6|nr:tautomerase family protein [Rhizobium sp. BK251]TCL71163.1 4-oxalocrotonate tautomerase [Rhizobium sp. BK251]
MPLVLIKAVENIFTEEQKGELIRRVTDAVVAVDGERTRPITWVVLEDVKAGEWGIGGELIRPEHVKAIRDGSLRLSDALKLD